MKRNIIALLGALLLLSGTAFADAPASGTVGGNEIHVSAEGLNPGYYLGAVWDGDKLLTFFDITSEKKARNNAVSMVK